MADTNRALFITGPMIAPQVSPNVVGRTAALYFNDGPQMAPFNNNLKQGKPMIDQIKAGVDIYNNLPPDMKDTARKFAGDVINGVRNGGGRRHSSGYALSKAPDPLATSLDSGIKPNAYTSDLLDAEENKCSPLHLTCVKLSFPTSATNKLYDYFVRIAAFDVQTKAQANVGFNLNVNVDLTADKILTAMNAALYAFQVYYYYTSVISYQSYYENKNEGMLEIRRSITSPMLEAISQLGRRLSDTPFPPKLFELVRYLNSNYYSGDLQGSAMIKICPVPVLNSENMANVTSLNDAINSLNTASNNQVFTLLRRAIPQWKPGILKDVEPLPSFDQNFLTIFANLPSGNTVVGFEKQPTVASVTDTIAYNSFTNVLDGVAFALTAMNVHGTGWLPSLMVPQEGSSLNTRRSFYKVGASRGFYDSDASIFLSRSRPETHSFNDARTAILSLHLSGADKLLGVSAETLRETTMSVIDYLMSADTIIKSQTSRDMNNPSATSSNTRSRGRSKSKSNKSKRG